MNIAMVCRLAPRVNLHAVQLSQVKHIFSDAVHVHVYTSVVTMVIESIHNYEFIISSVST